MYNRPITAKCYIVQVACHVSACSMVFYKYHACLFRAVSDSEEMDVSQHAVSGHLASLQSHEISV